MVSDLYFQEASLEWFFNISSGHWRHFIFSSFIICKWEKNKKIPLRQSSDNSPRKPP